MICPNPQCRNIVSVFDDVCSHCGTPLKDDSPIKQYLKEADRITGHEARSSAGQRSSSTQAHAATQRAQREGAQAKRSLAEVDDIEREIEKRLMVETNKLLEIKGMIFANPHVLTNDEWRAKGKQTGFWFDWENEEANAYVSLINEDEIPETDDRYRYLIRLYGGYVYYAFAVATAYNEDPLTMGLYNMDRLGQAIRIFRENKGRFSILDVVNVLPDTSKIPEYASNAFKIIYECIAHELGHICYGHVYSPGYDYQTKTANISQETDADSFAYALIGSSVFKKELWMGLVQFMVIQAAKEILFGQITAATHPLGIDRLRTAIRRFPDLADAYKIDEQWAEKIVTKIYAWLK